MNAVASLDGSSRASSTSRWWPSSRRCTPVALPPLVERGGIGAFCSMGNGLIQDRMEGIVGRGEPAGLHRRVGRLQRRPGPARARLARRLHGRRADGTVSVAARELAAALEPVGRTRVTDNVRGMIWSKLLINSTFTGLSAVSGPRYGGAAEQGRDAVFCLWREGVAVGEAQGLELVEIHDVHPHAFDEAGLAAMMQHMANVRPSMLQDLDAGRETEVDVVNGGVVAKGREVGVATPCNERVVEVVHSIERGERSSEPRWLAYVSDSNQPATSSSASSPP